MTPELLKKINDGDGLSDEELATAITFYTQLEESLKLLGPTFYHAWYDVFFTLSMLMGFDKARKDRLTS